MDCPDTIDVLQVYRDSHVEITMPLCTIYNKRACRLTILGRYSTKCVRKELFCDGRINCAWPYSEPAGELFLTCSIVHHFSVQLFIIFRLFLSSLFLRMSCLMFVFFSFIFLFPDEVYCRETKEPEVESWSMSDLPVIVLVVLLLLAILVGLGCALRRFLPCLSLISRIITSLTLPPCCPPPFIA